MGFMLLYFSPSFYTDCTDMHLFDNTAKRIWTIIAGIWVTLLQSCFGVFLWAISPPGSLASDLGFKLAILAGLGGFLQLNPLMKIDGYYVLSQYLQIDNLREQSFAYLATLAKKYLLWFKVELPPLSRRERRIFFTYGVAAGAYSFLLLAVVVEFANNVLVEGFGSWGHVMTVGLLYFLLRKRLQLLARSAVDRMRNFKENLMAWKMSRWQQGLGATAVLLLVIPPTAVKVTSDFVLVPERKMEVRAPVAGVLKEITVCEGQTVQEGTVLAILHNPEIEARALIVDQQLKLAENSLREAQARLDSAASERSLQEQRRLQAERTETTRKLSELTLRTPIAGVIVTPRVEQRAGEYLAEGQQFSLVVDRQTMRARILVRDWELEDVEPGAEVSLKLRSYAFKTFSGRVSQVMPAASTNQPVAEPTRIERKGQELTNFFEVTMEFPNPDGVLKEGMTGTARISGKSYPVAWRAVRAGWRLLGSQIW